MATTSFSTTYRPNDFTGYNGVETKEMITNIMSGDPSTWPHTWLLWGEKGTGKTTLGCLLAKWYSCYSPTEHGPCNECAMCKEVDETLIYADSGTECYNIQMLDIANDSGKAKIGEALEEALMPPQAPSRFKILILDECHMASKAAQNSLLKICENPPPHLVIIFCTTNPENMLETLYDRCTFKIKAKKSTPEELLGRLRYCCEKEQISYSDNALKMIIKKCGRNPRKSFNKLEEIAKANRRVCDLEAVKKFTDAKLAEVYQDFFEASQSGLGELMMYIKKLQEQEVDLKQFVRGLSGYVLDCVKVRFGIGVDDYTTEFIKATSKLFKDYTATQFDTLLQIVEYANTQLSSANITDDYAELIITTTGMRLSKLGFLAQGLQGEEQVAQRETRVGSKEAIALKQAEYEASKPKPIGQQLSGDLLQATYGRTVAEVVPTTKVSTTNLIDEEEDDEDEEEMDSQEFENLLRKFSPNAEKV